MSAAIKAKNAKTRAKIAARMIISDTWENERLFDDCFEMGDGNEVMNYIIEMARSNRELSIALKNNLPELGAGDYNKRLHIAIEECLNPRTLFNI